MVGTQAGRAGLFAAVAAVTISSVTSAAQFYYGGYDGTAAVPQGTPDLPVSGPFVVAGQTTFYSDAAGTLPNAAGAGFVTANDTSADLILGGTAAATAYTVTTPTSSGTPAIHGITLQANNPGTNTINLGFTGSGRYTFASGGAGVINGVGITQLGSANWNFVNAGGSSAPLRAQNSFVIQGSGSGNISIPFNIANVSGQPSLGVNLSGGATLTLGARNDFSGTGGTPNFTLTNGTVDFGNSRSFGGFNVQIRLNGGTLLSSAGASIDNGYVGVGGVATESPIRIGGNVTFAGTTAWGTGTAAVLINGNRTITAKNTSATGTTIGGVINDAGGAFGLTVGAASTGKLTLNGNNTYTGTTVVAGGTLVLGPNAQNPVLVNAGGANVQAGTLVMQYPTGNSNAATIRGLLQTSFAGAFLTGQFKSTTANANKGLGYIDDTANNQVIVKPALYGDADLDGGVTIIDFNALATAFGSNSGKVWVDGDFDYDGAVGITDFNALAVNFGQSLPPADRAEALAPLLAFAIAHDDLATFAALTGVPEPTSLGLIAAGAVVGLRRRRSAH